MTIQWTHEGPWKSTPLANGWCAVVNPVRSPTSGEVEYLCYATKTNPHHSGVRLYNPQPYLHQISADAAKATAIRCAESAPAQCGSICTSGGFVCGLDKGHAAHLHTSSGGAQWYESSSAVGSIPDLLRLLTFHGKEPRITLYGEDLAKAQTFASALMRQFHPEQVFDLGKDKL